MTRFADRGAAARRFSLFRSWQEWTSYSSVVLVCRCVKHYTRVVRLLIELELALRAYSLKSDSYAPDPYRNAA